jgi:hypothetical protein
MASEKSRYMKRKQKPPSPFSIEEIVSGAASLPHARLCEIVALRADWDDILRHILCLSLAIRSLDLVIAKAAVDNIMSIFEPIRYDDSGHGQILYEIERELVPIADKSSAYALEVGRYAIMRAQNIAEMFEDDWDWTSSIESLEKFVASISL